MNFSICILLTLLTVLTLREYVSARIANCYVVPHGTIALDPTHFNTTNKTVMREAWLLHDSFKAVGEEIVQLQPDLIFLSTPHGVADQNDFVFYNNSIGSGFSDAESCPCPPCCYFVNVTLNTQITNKMVGMLGQARNVSSITAFNGALPFPLR